MRFDHPSSASALVYCTSCARPVQLDLEGTSGVAGYDTYNEFFCPHCRKLNQPRTAGRILAARLATPA